MLEKVFEVMTDRPKPVEILNLLNSSILEAIEESL